ncbi:MAG: hypothetical protein Q9160_001626 [Pyrenula sp. 1 TL-2023]
MQFYGKRMRNAAKKDSKESRERKSVADGSLASTRDILDSEIRKLVKGHTPEKLPEPFSEIELEIVELSATGDGLALFEHESGSHVYAVPFSIPGDTVLAKVIRHHPLDRYSEADFLKVLKPSSNRSDDRIKCKYFSKCSGCQLQMMSYEDQLQYKQRVMEDAYRNFSRLPPEEIPEVESTQGSPLQYSYRTKLTPHFDSGHRKRTADGEYKWSQVPPIGFSIKGQRKVMDIEECPIGTEVVNKGLVAERARLNTEIENYKQGATLLLRESTKKVMKNDINFDADQAVAGEEEPKGLSPDHPQSKTKQDESSLESTPSAATVQIEHPSYTLFKTCITSHNATATEYVDGRIFNTTAGSFFQNNNSILKLFTTYIRGLCLPIEFPTSKSIPPEIAAKVGPPPPARAKTNYLLDAYCGSGLFAVMLSSLFRSTLGIDIDERGIAAARKNAELNRVESPTLPLITSREQAREVPLMEKHSVGFIAADAARLFEDVPYPASETLVVIDPPRKGCSLDFLKQLRQFGPRRIICVSCNVHTQARDVGWLVRGGNDGDKGGHKSEENEKDQGKEEDLTREGKVTKYRIGELAPWDFFPQTAHVEGVAVLERVEARVT